MKVALVHDYLTQRGGAERVFEILCKFFPSADIFTSLYDRKRTIDLGSRLVQTSLLQNIPGATRYFRLLAPFYFPAFKSLNLQDYELIISSTSSFAKALIKRPEALHICFCHNVTRFLWNTEIYLREYNDYNLYAPLIKRFFKLMREIDLEAAKNPDIYIANSSVVAERITKIYQRNAMVINYPIDTSKFLFSSKKEDFYLVFSRLLSYKKVDLIVEAFNWLGWPLLIVGDGPERKYLQSKALSNIQFLGYVSDKLRASLMSRSSGIIIAALEDYGLVPIEANASGTPVIAYDAGGIIDTQIAGETAILFKPQTPEALIKALIKARDTPWNYTKIRDHALMNFSEKVFFGKIKQLIQPLISDSASDIFTNLY